MRTVAEVRRELGVGAPREKNSLYRPIERGPRKFNPLKIPKQLQVDRQPLWSTQIESQMAAMLHKAHLQCPGLNAQYFIP